MYNADLNLNSGQSLVYFMQGPTGTGFAPDGPFAATRNVAKGPYYNFQPSRLIQGDTLGNFAFNALGVPTPYSRALFYKDSFGSPYAYFGSQKVGGKYSATESFTWNYTTVFPIVYGNKFVNEKTCPIICAGENGADDSYATPSPRNANSGFGAGAAWIPGSNSYAGTASGGDDFGNFNGGAPMNRRGD